MRALASNQYDCVQSRHQWQTWVEFNLLLILSFCSERFSLGSQVFTSPQKLTVPNSYLTRNMDDEEPPCRRPTNKLLFVYLFILWQDYLVLLVVLGFYCLFYLEVLEWVNLELVEEPTQQPLPVQSQAKKNTKQKRLDKTKLTPS